MYLDAAKFDETCSRDGIFAYLDGELSTNEELNLEVHFAECRRCADEVNAQKKVSNSLEIILEAEMKSIELPENFTEIVTAKAESNVSGLRQKKEITHALWISGGLLFLVALGLGTKVKSVWVAGEQFLGQFSAVIGFVSHLIYDAATGFVIILRTLSHKFVFGSFVSLLLVAVVFVVAFLSLSRLILRHSRS